MSFIYVCYHINMWLMIHKSSTSFHKMKYHFNRFVMFIKQLIFKLTCISFIEDQFLFEFVNQSFLILSLSQDLQNQHVRQQSLNQQNFVANQLRQIKSRMSERLITMKSRINEQLIKLNSKMKAKLIEKFLTIKKISSKWKTMLNK